MKLTPRIAPHIRSSVSNKTVMGDAVISLAAVYVIAWFYYGLRAVALGALSAGVCWSADILCTLWRGRAVNRVDFSPVVTGMIIPLLLPASVDYAVVVTAGIFAICVVKQAFGGLGSNVFNPAAGGLAFVIVCWSGKLFAYPGPFAPLALTGTATERLLGSTAATLKMGGVPPYDVTSMVLGLVPGPMGTTNILVIAACMLYLCVRGTVRLQQPLIFLATAAAWAAVFPRVPADPLYSVFYELTGTPLLFAAVFLFTDPVTTPRRAGAKAIYAFVSALLVMLFQWYGGYEMTIPFALLMGNALVPALDSAVERYITAKRRAKYGRRQQKSDLAAERAEIDAVQ